MECEERVQKLEEKLGTLHAEVSVIQAELVPLKEGVRNFRSFQERGTRYFDTAEERMRQDDIRRADKAKAAELEARHKRDRIKMWQWLASLLALFMVPLSAYLVYHWWIFTQDVIQMDEEWHHSHTLNKPHDNYFYGPQSANHPPQDATIPANP